MDVTPQLIEQIDFSEKFRGYDPDQVDDFLERVGATLSTLQSQVDDLGIRVQRAETEAAALRDQPPPAPRVGMSDEEEVEQATRTLLLAKRTAEAAIAEARQEASQLVSDARSRADTQTSEATAEADRLLREAQTQREELLRKAREDADREKVAQRDQLLEEIAGLDRRKVELVGDIDRLEERMAEYRSGLEQVHAAIGVVLDDPAALRVQPSLGIDANDPPTSSAFYYTGSNPVVSAAESIPLAPNEHVGAEDVSVVPPEAGPDVDPDAGTADPWAPGSWSEVSSAFEESSTTSLFEAPAFEATGHEATGQQPAVSPFDAVEDVFEPAAPPTEAIQRTESDRYLQDLDDAVNRTAPGDQAMEAFFEGEDGGSGRRFGRRR